MGLRHGRATRRLRRTEPADASGSKIIIRLWDRPWAFSAKEDEKPSAVGRRLCLPSFLAFLAEETHDALGLVLDGCLARRVDLAPGVVE